MSVNLAALQPQLLRAQSLHQAGRVGEAWAILSTLRPALSSNGPGLRLYAVVAQSAGQTSSSIEALTRIAAIEREPPDIVGALADTLGKAGRHEEALGWWTRLTAKLPRVPDVHLNRSVAAANAGLNELAVEAADAGLKIAPGHARLLAVKAMALKNGGRVEESLPVFTEAVAADPARALTRHNQAVALRAAGQFDAACEAFAASERLGLKGVQFQSNWAAAALEAGRVAEAVDRYRQALADDPGHAEALKGLTRIHIEYRTGEDPFAHYETLTTARPGDPGSWLAWANALSASQRYEQAAEAAKAGLDRNPGHRLLEMVAAFNSGMTGDPARPLAVLEAAYRDQPDDPLVWSPLQQIALRRGVRPDLAAEVAQRAVANDSMDQSAWSILTLAWRLLDDPREAWLCDYDRLVMVTEVTPHDEELTAQDYAGIVAQALWPLHQTVEAPGDQSLRQGTQTAGALFDIPSPAIKRFQRAVSDAAARAVAALPDDANHPFLRRKATSFTFSGSWSVKLKAGGGHHIPHFHSQGWMSSAYYARLPQSGRDDAGRHEGWIEFGRPPASFELDLEPRRVVEPVEGRLVLFPSYFWHGTVPFKAGERLTAAFDYLPA